MLGVVFTEFLEMVESRYSAEILDSIIDASSLGNDGAYTAVGKYDYHEILRLVSALSEKTKVPTNELVEGFGKHLLKRFAVLYPVFFANSESTFEFLKQVDSHIHTEVLKLYPEAELPKFVYKEPESGVLIMEYSSSRPLGFLALGLIKGVIDYFEEDIELVVESGRSKNSESMLFLLRKY